MNNQMDSNDQGEGVNDITVVRQNVLPGSNASTTCETLLSNELLEMSPADLLDHVRKLKIRRDQLHGELTSLTPDSILKQIEEVRNAENEVNERRLRDIPRLEAELARLNAEKPNVKSKLCDLEQRVKQARDKQQPCPPVREQSFELPDSLQAEQREVLIRWYEENDEDGMMRTIIQNNKRRKEMKKQMKAEQNAKLRRNR